MHRRGIAGGSEGRPPSDSDNVSSDNDDECDHSSNDANDSDSASLEDNIYSDDDSSSSDSERSAPQETLYQHTSKSEMRRRHSPLEQHFNDKPANDDDKSHRHSSSRSRRNIKRGSRDVHDEQGFFQECFMFYRDACPCLCNRRTNAILVFCFMLWFIIQFHDAWSSSSYYREDAIRTVRKHPTHKLRNNDNHTRSFGWGDAQQALENLMPNSRPRKRTNKEILADGCKRPEWQTFSFPNCNELHHFDLREEFGLRRRNRVQHDDEYSNNSTETFGYVGSGLWRHVWKLRGYENMPLVIKMMKGEHDVDRRNLDRHRRDALSMERLTWSPNIVSIYGYCGNTVLTEYIPRGLDALVYHDGDVKQNDTVATRQTPLGRLRLALSVARGVAAIHTLAGGPIIHADIQTKQFLVDSQGIVKLNDFNRCRFMPNNTKTGSPCAVHIPSAPGASRSPEEYKFDDLTEKLDIFSTAHVLYAILTGERPWDDLWGSQVKKLVKAGNKPAIVDKKYLESGSSDAALANLIDMAYEFDPRDRISASQLVAELERLVAAEEGKH